MLFCNQLGARDNLRVHPRRKSRKPDRLCILGSLSNLWKKCDGRARFSKSHHDVDLQIGDRSRYLPQIRCRLWFNIIDYMGSATRMFADHTFDGDPTKITEEEVSPLMKLPDLGYQLCQIPDRLTCNRKAAGHPASKTRVFNSSFNCLSN